MNKRQDFAHRRVRRGGALGARAAPYLKKVPLRNAQNRKESSAQICRQERTHVPLRYDKIKTKKGVREKRRKI